MLSYDSILQNMLDEYKSLSGSTPYNCSDISIRLKVLASQVFSIYSRLEWVKNQVFPQTASGIFLDYHAQTRGITRKKSAPSSGVLNFSTDSPATADILIPKGTICYSTRQPILRFATTEDTVLKSGSSSVAVTASSLQNTLDSNISATTILQIINPPTAVQSVSNPAPFSGGCGEESDQELRKRLLDNFSNISNGANSAFYHDMAMKHEKVSSVNVLPRNRGRGTVDVVIASGNTPVPPDLIKSIQASLQEAKEINVDVSVLPTKFKKVDMSIQLQIQTSFPGDSVIENCKASVQKFFADLKISQPLKIAALGSQIFHLPGVSNYKFIFPNLDIIPRANELIILGNLTVLTSD